MRTALIWTTVVATLTVPLLAAGFSPYLEFRQPIYIVAGFAGVIGLCVLVLQPLLAGGYLPGLRLDQSRRLHRLVGGLLLIAVLVHVGGLWITSPPDVIDALTFTSPTPFSAWGVIAMWAVFASALWATLRKRWRSSLRSWRTGHRLLGLTIVACTVVHTLLIQGTMEVFSKLFLCLVVLGAAFYAMILPRLGRGHQRD